MSSYHSTQNPVFVDAESKLEPKAAPKVDLRPTLIIIVSAVLGLILGISLADGRAGAETVSWIKLPGDLFIRALKAIVLPLVFVNIALASIDMIRAGKAGSVACSTIGLYLLTTFFAAMIGLVFVLMFKGTFEVENPVLPNSSDVQIKCPFSNEFGTETFVSQVGTQLLCQAKDQNELLQTFELNNSNGFLLETPDANGLTGDISFSETLQSGIFEKLISENITGDFVNENFAGIIVFAILLGFSAQRLNRMPEVFLAILEELNRVFLKIVDWIIFLTPVAIFFLVAGNIGEQDELGDTFRNLGIFTTSVLLGLAVHAFVFYPLLFYFFVRKNPFSYIKFLFPAQAFAFASSSSAATLPLTLECVQKTGEVPASVANFALSMGSTINMDGGAIYFPAALCYIAIAEGREDELNAATFFLMILLTTIGSAGTAPIPSAGQVLIITAYNTVFDTSGIPRTFELLLAIDWFVDRFRTVVNITGDAIIARIVASISKVEETDEILLREANEGEIKRKKTFIGSTAE